MREPNTLVWRIAADLVAHGGDPKRVTTTSSDMRAAFIAGSTAPCPTLSSPSAGAALPERLRRALLPSLAPRTH